MARSDKSSSADSSSTNGALGLWYRHMRIGWWSLFAFAGLGLFLDALHGLKIGWYLNVDTETRRLMWTLAHAHGTILSLVHLGFAAAVLRMHDWKPSRRETASACLVGAIILMPIGFFLGGVTIYAGDPGVGSLLVPPGGLLLLFALLLTALAVRRPPDGSVENAEVLSEGGKKKNRRRP